MNKQIPSYLKLLTDTSAEIATAEAEDLAGLTFVCQAFERATGWQLQYAGGPAPSEKSNLMWSAPVDPGVGASPGHIRLISTDEPEFGQSPRVPLEHAVHLAGALGKLWGELLATRHALWQREAELAAGVPLVLHEGDPDSPRLGERLEAVLRGGAEAVGCHAAALYLLDPATTELKLRSSWGLPRKRLTEPARPLRGALADLEALLGHAVVMTDDQLHDHWKVPEVEFASCVCLPVSSPTMPLGTLWVFCREPRDFTAVQTNILEVVAGRLAADLERQVLVHEVLSSRGHSDPITAAEQSQHDQLPRIAPMIEGWEIAAKAYHAGPLGGTFYDWFSLADGALSVMAGDSLERGVGGALTASALRATARALGPERKPTPLLLEKANTILWTGSAGNQSAGLFQAVIDPASEAISFSAAGPVRVLAVRTKSCQPLWGPSDPLGSQEELRLDELRHRPAPGELVLVYGTSFLAEPEESILAALDQRLSVSLQSCLALSAGKLAAIAGGVLEAHPAMDAADRVLVVMKRQLR
ncbi:MAG: GAF domain-containing protein [Planctomycetia bacterium]|nr:GAF domain-containing protein [Planctomycetia bacterium]